MRLWPWSPTKTVESTPTPAELEVAERLEQLERRFDQLHADWDEVLERFNRRVARAAALKRHELVKQLDSEAASVDPGANGTVESAEALPSKAQLWAMARRRA